MTVKSRTVHVTVTFSVEVDVSDAKTKKAALDWAIQNYEKGNQFDSSAKVFEINTQEEHDAAERISWRQHWMKNHTSLFRK